MSEDRDLGLQALQQGNITEAVANLEKAIAANPQDYTHIFIWEPPMAKRNARWTPLPR